MQSNPSIFILSDQSIEGASLAVNIASKISDNVIWVCGENPIIADRIAKAYGIEIESHSIRSLNIANLNEISILFTKTIENKRRFSIIISFLSELILVHGLEKSFLFLSNIFNKVEDGNGILIGLMIKDAQSRRDEILISRLFSDIFYLQREIGNENPKLILISEAPIGGKFVFELKHKGYRVEITKEIEEYLKKLIS